MKIFHSFDTNLKQKDYKRLVGIFGEDKVILIERSFFFWLIRGIVPLFIFILFSFLIYFLSKYIYTFFITGAYTILVLWSTISIYILHRTYRTYINYKMDFSLVTPDEFVTHKQKGLFKSNYKNIPAQKVRSVQSRHSGFIGNICDYGLITILTDGGLAAADDKEIDSSGAGMIRLTYLSKPNKVKRKIMLICVHKGSLKDIEEGKYKI